MPFPRPGDRCETCGYPIQGLNPDAHCPECGTPLAQSNPDQRAGLPWDQRFSLNAALHTALSLVARPKATPRQHDFSRSNLAPRLYLLIIAAFCGFYTTLFLVLARLADTFIAWGIGMIVFNTVIILTYIEAFGVTLFSRRRRWSVPLRHSERIVSYAAVGWIPAVALLVKLVLVVETHMIPRFQLRQLLPNLYLNVTSIRLSLYALGFAVAILGFETLVWTGVRQCRFANAAYANTKPAERL